MKLSTGWRANKTKKNQIRATRKPKIRWDVLGLPTLVDTSLIASMDDIRKEVSDMASRGFGQETRSRSMERETRTAHQAAQASAKRRRSVPKK